MRVVFKKDILRVFIALVLITLIMFAANYLVFNNSMNELYTQTVENNGLILQNTLRSYDDCFKDVNDIISNLGYTKININDAESENGLDMYNTMGLYQKLSQYAASRDFIEDIIVFFKNSPIAVTSKGTISMTHLFQITYSNSKYAVDFWKNFSETSHPLQVVPAAEYSVNNGDNNSTGTKRLIGIVGSNLFNNTDQTILVFIDAEKFLSVTGNTGGLKSTSLIVMDTDKNIILNTAGNENPDDIGSIYFGQSDKISFRKGDYQYYCLKSDYNNYIYIYRILSDTGKFSSTLRNNQLLLLFSILVGISLCILLSFYLHKPIKKILGLITGSNARSCGNDYSNIYSTIERFKCENDDLRRQIAGMEYDVRRSIFFELLNNAYGRKDKAQVEKYFDNVMRNNVFFMAVFIFNGNRNGPENDKITFPQDETVQLIQKATGERFGSSAVFHTGRRQFTALIGLDRQDKREIIERHFSEIAYEMRLTNQAGYHLTIVFSRFFTDLQECGNACSEIKMCLAYSEAGKNSSDRVMDIEKTSFGQDVYFPDDLLEKLSNCLLFGNTEECLKIINLVVDKNLAGSISNIKLMHIAGIIFDRIVRVKASRNINENEVPKLEKAFFEMTQTSAGIYEIRDFLEETVFRICGKPEPKKQDRLNKDFVLQYIDFHYQEDLYLDNMAEYFGTTAKYFSNFFKKTCDVNFVDYLNRVRIRHAKEYLEQTDISIHDIMKKVGYKNSSFFASAFRKHCGLSPSEYREHYRMKKVK